MDTLPSAGARYAASQIMLHWAVVALVAVQWLTHDAMEDYWDLLEHGEARGLPNDPVALVHAASGAAILVLMLVRIIVRLRRGAPPLPESMPAILRLAAHLNHFAFYVLLLLLPLSGAAAILLGLDDAADLHGLLVLVLFLLVAAHLGGVVYHTFIRRDGLLWRMILPRR